MFTMKKQAIKCLVTIILCLGLLLSLAACGESAAPKTPTQADLDAIGYYERAMNQLERYAETGAISFVFADYGMASEVQMVGGQQALSAIYTLLTELGAVDQWVGTEHITNTDINWDREAVLERFSVLENVLVGGSFIENYRDRDPVENNLTGVLKYDADGKVTSIADIFFKGEVYDNAFDLRLYTSCNGWLPEYNANGQVTALDGGSHSLVDGKAQWQTSATVTFTYDASGKMTKLHLTNKYWDMDVLYTYDSEGRLSRVSWNEDAEKQITIDYFYDDVGRCVKTVEKIPQRDSYGNFTILGETTTQYAYEGGMQPLEKTTAFIHFEKGAQSLLESPYSGWGATYGRTDTCRYTYDDAGRVIEKVLTFGDTSYYEGARAGETQPYTVETEVYTFVYGDYYFYAE